jgi:hypothetical protein
MSLLERLGIGQHCAQTGKIQGQSEISGFKTYHYRKFDHSGNVNLMPFCSQIEGNGANDESAQIDVAAFGRSRTLKW